MTGSTNPVAEKAYRPDGYTAADQRSDTSFLVGVRYGWRKAMGDAAALTTAHAAKTNGPADDVREVARLLREQANLPEVPTPTPPTQAARHHHDLLTLLLTNAHVAVSGDNIIVEGRSFPASAPLRAALAQLMEEVVDSTFEDEPVTPPDGGGF